LASNDRTCDVDLTLSNSDEDVDPIDHSRSKKCDEKESNGVANRVIGLHGNDVVDTLKNRALSSQRNHGLEMFSICSYNLWFHPLLIEERMSHVSQIISELSPRPTFIGLQEVTPEIFEYLSPLLQYMGYVFIHQKGVAYGCAIGILVDSKLMCREEITPLHARVIHSGFQPYSTSQMSRGLLWVHANVETVGEVLFTTTHLESYIPGNDGSRERELQLQEASRFCLEKMNQSYQGCLKGVFITGDLNWDDERKRSTGTDKHLLTVIQHSQQDITPWMDSWLETNPGQDGYSYDSKINPMLKGNLRRRFDRCLSCFRRNDKGLSVSTTATATPIATPIATDLVGKDAIPGLTWRKEVAKWTNGRPTREVTYDFRPVAPSDHFGLFASFHVMSCKELETKKPKKKQRTV
jgi:tyrosyl-DNA phosphodiesterase 2